MKKMWKGLLAVFASLLLFAAPALVNATEAPRNKLVGVWMLIYEGNTYYKQITKDGRFINLAPDTETGVFYVSRQGTYELKEKNHYVETITHEWRRVDRSHNDARLQDSQVTPVRRRSPRAPARFSSGNRSAPAERFLLSGRGGTRHSRLHLPPPERIRGCCTFPKTYPENEKQSQ